MKQRNALVIAPRAFRQSMGDIVFAFAELELTASEVITGKARNYVMNSAWAQSGAQFIKELRRCFPDDQEFNALCNQLSYLGKQRNTYIHSSWLFYDDGSAFLMNRLHRKNANHPIDFEIETSVALADLTEFVARIKKLDEDFLPFVLKAMEGRYVQG